MKESPRVSVIIPAYNESQKILRCVQSVLSTDYPNLEVLVVNDASTDLTFQVVSGFKDPRVRCVHQAVRRGAGYARNRGYEESSGEFLFFTDADCLVDKAWISEGLRCFENSGVVAVEGAILYLPSVQTFVSKFPVNPFYPKASFPILNKDTRDYAAGCFAMRRRIFSELGGFRADLFKNGREDTDLGVRALKLGKVVFCELMRVRHVAEFWTWRELLCNARRYSGDVTFLKQHGWFELSQGVVLHPRLWGYLFKPWSVWSAFRFESIKDVKLLPAFYFYLVALRLHIWKAALKERCLAL